jgi:hypothetical protein
LITHLDLSEKPIKGAKVCRNHVPWIQVLRHCRGFDNLVEVFHEFFMQKAKIHEQARTEAIFKRRTGMSKLSKCF